MPILYIIGIFIVYVLAVAYAVEDKKGAYHIYPVIWTAVLIGSIIWFKWVIISWPFTLWPTVGIVLAYFVAGAAWSIFKWLQFNKREFKRLNTSQNADIIKKLKPLPEDHKETLSAWILWWPFSSVHYVFGDLLKDFIDGIRVRLNGIYVRVSDKVFGS